MEKQNVEYGDPESVLPNVILKTVVGSGVHGIAIEGTDDHDEMGIYIPPEFDVLGIRNVREDYIYRTQPEGARSGPGDTDLVLYSLRKYLRLAIKGNPTALLPLYAPESAVLERTWLGMKLRTMKGLFLSEQAVRRFLGYMESQHERMMGEGKRNRVPNRPELVEKHGWDTKYGSHALRLAYQGYEIASEGHLTLPLKPAIRDTVLAVKRGEIERDVVSGWITDLAADVSEILENGKAAVPEYPDFDRINEWCVYAHQAHWEGE